MYVSLISDGICKMAHNVRVLAMCGTSCTNVQYDLNGNFIKEWDSATEAKKCLNISSQGISTCCVGKGKQKTARGFIWKFKEIII